MSDDDDADRLVKYRVISEVFNPPEDHREVEDGVYVGEPFDGLETAAGGEWIEIIDDDWVEVQTEYWAPPEILEKMDGSLKLLYPKESNRLGSGGMQTGLIGAYRCQRCSGITELPATKGDDLGGPHECSGCERQGPFKHAYIPDEFRPADWLTTDPFWPRIDHAEESSFGRVWDKVYNYIEEHWASAGREYLYEGLTAFAISTWFRPAFEFVPHLLVIGKTQTGKTRLLNTLAQVSYHGFVTANTTPPHIFRSIDLYDVTYFVSEYHDLNQEIRDSVDAVLKSGQKRGEMIGRTQSNHSDGGWEPQTFDILSHFAIATQYEPRDDIINRGFRVTTRPADRPMPPSLDDAVDIRNEALWLRCRYLRSPAMKEAQQDAEQHFANHDIDGRLREALWAPLTVAKLADRDISNFIEVMDDAAEQDKEESEDATVLRCIVDEVYERLTDSQTTIGTSDGNWSRLKVPYADICGAYEDMTGVEMSSSKLGHIIKRLDLEKERYRDGTYIQDDQLQSKLKRLCEENNVEWTPAQNAEDADELPQGDRVEKVHNIIDDVAAENDGTAPEDEVVARAEDEGIDRDWTEDYLDKAQTKGKLLSDGSNGVRTV